MSGSGGGGGGGFNDKKVSCEELVINTRIGSPKPASSTIKTGDILNVELNEEGVHATIELTHEGKVIGGVSDVKVNQLRACLQSGFKYQAKVTKKQSDSEIEIRIEAY